MAALTMTAAMAPVAARASATRRSPRAVRAAGLKTVNGIPAFATASTNAKFAAVTASTRVSNGPRMATTASAFPIAEVANQSIEIATIAVNCFGITLIGLAIGFVLLRVEAAVEGEE